MFDAEKNHLFTCLVRECRNQYGEDLVSLSVFGSAARIKVLEILFREHDYSDVVREAQEIVELVLKGMLRKLGIKPPKLHDAGSLLIEHARPLFS